MQQAQFIEVSAGVRYWEDARLNGQEDTEGKVPLRNGDRWTPVIDLEGGQIQDWPQGVIADIHYKVCDDGDYWLLDSSKVRLAKWRGYYVPDSLLCVNDKGFGDYIIFKVTSDGRILNWKKPHLNPDQWQTLERA
jgi:hypothetical protein